MVQIPCLNEEDQIAATLADIPRQVDGFDVVEVLIIDDGSTDGTVRAAREAGADHVLSFSHNRGLAAAFMAGLEQSLRLGADVIVHTDADNQYNGASIPDLVRPVVQGRADLVVGVRPIEMIEEFSWAKKRLQRLGSWVVRKLSSTEVADVTSGFRAYSREAALRLTVVSEFTYTHETLIQAGRSGMAVTQVPIGVNPATRPSRLFKGIPQYIRRSLDTIFRIYAVYQPFRLFTGIGAVLFFAGVMLGVRYLYFISIGRGQGHVQSVILAGVLMILGFQAGILGMLADLIGANRKLLQETLYRVRRMELETQRDAGAAAGDKPEPDTAHRDG
jgi:glycosyltransferase involved in cell wall biosynthesis